MKKEYRKPVINIEHYELTENIASGCDTVVNPDPTSCGFFGEIELDGASGPESPFNQNECECYNSALQSNTFTS